MMCRKNILLKILFLRIRGRHVYKKFMQSDKGYTLVRCVHCGKMKIAPHD